MHDAAVNTSYLEGVDAIGDWGRRYFFTFYSEFGARDGAAAAEAAVLACVLAASAAANLAIGAAVLRHRELRTVTNCFLLNLVAADLVFALGIPAVAVTRVTQQWVLGDVVCRLLPYSQFVCGFVLLWTLTLISADRHRCIVVPPYRSGLTPRRAAALTAATWLLGALLFLPVAFWFREQRCDGGRRVCTLVFPRSDRVNVSLCFTLPTTLLACLLPMALLVFHYQRIFRKLLDARGRWAVPCVVVTDSGGDKPPRRDSELSYVGSLVLPWARKPSQQQCFRSGSLSQHEELRLSKHLRVVRVLLLNVLVVLLMWLPITVVMFLIYVDGRRPNEDTAFFLNSCHFLWSLVVALLNTVVNPLLYGVLSENFRACFARWWRCGGGGGGGGNPRGLAPAANRSCAGTRTPSSGRGSVAGLPPPRTPRKKNSTCSVASILEAPAQYAF
ncbi:free fatty acid receptor 4-like [Bacillus rossius redtenbacheri]|uniref:free fatty acid receptor 4-like n=1 Tax=Bacillus rossius redtenbacheri TaxID=93214 RepID=UPI002FDD9D0F